MGATMTTTGDPSVLAADADAEELDTRLAAGADRLRTLRRSILENPHLLLAVSATLMTSGVVAIILGWLGAAHATLIEEQFPYLISGGLLGVALSTIGALLFFTHWLTVAVKEARQHEAARRRDHDELVEALRALSSSLNGGGGTDGGARSARAGRQVRRAPRRS